MPNVLVSVSLITYADFGELRYLYMLLSENQRRLHPNNQILTPFTQRKLKMITGSLNPQNIETTKKLELDPYEELIRSIPEDERHDVINELNSDCVIARAQRLCTQLSNNERVGLNVDESRTLFLAALRNVRDKKISANQLATLHILDSAIRTLYVNPMMYFIHKYVDSNSKVAMAYNLAAVTNLRGLPTSVKRYPYNALIFPKEGMTESDLPCRMQKPLMQRFFNFTEIEWIAFVSEMANTPESEQNFHILIAPDEGCWSSIIFKIQKVLKIMRVLDWFVDSKDGFITEKIMLVPSFSMFQAAINAKAKTLSREPVALVPTYGYIEEEHYVHLKSFGKIALAMYLPEKRPWDRYNDDTGRFRTKIDGHPAETAFGGAIHDVYHAMREMAMSENVAKARFRLATIAKKHPKNQKDSCRRKVDEILIDGELIFSYPAHIDTTFCLERRSASAQIFGDIFYETSLRPALHEDLKRAFIEDMVVNKQLWEEEYQLDASDLREEDQKIYREITHQISQENRKKEHSDFNHLIQSKAFLQCVAYGQQEEAEAYLKQDPDFALELLKTDKIPFTDGSGRTFTCTAYEYAYWARDSHMQRMLEKYIRTNEETREFLLKRVNTIEEPVLPPSPSLFEQPKPRGLRYTTKDQEGNIIEHRQAHFSLKPLIDALEHYVTEFSNKSYKTEADWQVLNDDIWIKEVGGAQRNLPAHIAQEYCHPDRSFHDVTKNKELLHADNPKNLKRQLKLFNFKVASNNRWFSPEASLNDSGLGFSFAILREAHEWLVTGVAYGVGGLRAAIDLSAVKAIDEIRTADLMQSRENLSLPLINQTPHPQAVLSQ